MVLCGISILNIMQKKSNMLDVCIIRLLILHNKHTGALGMHGGTTKLFFSIGPKNIMQN